jgi:signal peptidase II
MDPENPAPPPAPNFSLEPAGPSDAPSRADVVPQVDAASGLAPEDAAPPSAGPASLAPQRHPSFIFLAVVAILSLASDIASKTWAEKHLDGFPGMVSIWRDHIAFVLAKNKGGAWGLLQGTSENVRRPFFLLVSVAAIAFIVTLYRRLLPTQRALKWATSSTGFVTGTSSTSSTSTSS